MYIFSLALKKVNIQGYHSLDSEPQIILLLLFIVFLQS